MECMQSQKLLSTHAAMFVGLFLTLVSFLPLVTHAVSMTGWGWSDSIGWISLTCANPEANTCATMNYGMTKSGAEGASGYITGYAWSDNIGWISANASDLTGCPSGTCDLFVASNGAVTGWMKALGAGGSWDGWIRFEGATYPSGYATGGLLTGWSWGDAVIGAILWSANQTCAATAGNFCDANAWKYRAPDCTVTTIIEDCGPSGCSAVTRQCVVIPPPTSRLVPSTVILRAAPRVVRKGLTSVVSWDVKDATSCTISGNGNTWNVMTGSFTTNPINNAVKYTLNCSGVGGTLVGSVIIRNPAKFQEI